MPAAEPRRRVAIVHPWMPQYRVAFFERLRESLAGHRLELAVAHGREPHFAVGRRDEARLEWAIPLREVHASIAGRNVVIRSPWRPALNADLLILEDGLRNLDTYAYLAARKPRRGHPTALWGHGRTMDHVTSPTERKLKERLVGSADWWFAYTSGTADHLASLGLPAERITDVGNSTDTAELAEAKLDLDPTRIERLRAEHSLTAGHTAIFIGGLSESKNLGLLIEAARSIHSRDPAFRVLVVGDGPERERVTAAATSCPAIVPIGPVFDPMGKAALAACADLMVLPGLAGLAVVDAFAMGLPQVAVSPWDHAPEFDYLESGRNCLIVEPRAEAFAAAIEELLADTALRERLASGSSSDAELFGIEPMVARFTDGILGALGAARADR